MDYNYLSNEDTFSTIFLDTKIMTKGNNTQIFRFMKMNEEQRKFVDGRMKVVKRSSWIRIDEDEAREIVENIFDKYDLDIDFYFMHELKHIPWALIIFTEEQDIAGHIVSVRRQERPGGPKIVFTTYDNNDGDEDGYVPKVGVIHMPSKRLCEYNSHRSPLFKTIWNELKDYDARHHWVLIMDELPDELKELSTEENTSLWNRFIERRKRFEQRKNKSHERRQTISPEMRERQRIMSRMTPEEKRIYIQKYKAMTLEQLLQYVHSKGFGYPLGRPWARITDLISLQTGGSNWTFPRLRNALILGGAIASSTDKEERFATQIYWTYKNGGYETMERFILNLKDEDWDGCGFKDDTNTFPLEDIKKEYARWLGVSIYPERRPYTLDEIFPVERYERLRRRAERYEARLNRQVDNESIVSIGPGGLNKDEIHWNSQHVSGMDKVTKERKWHY